MLHEVFLTAVVPDADAIKARAVLGGVTEMRERHQFTKVRYLHREDANPKSLDKFKELQKERNPNAARWQELHQILLKQSYIIQERINITQEISSANPGEPPASLPANKPRLLKWNDLPDPPSNRYPPFITQRKTLEIGGDPRLDKILADSKFGTRAQSIEESCHWWLNNAEYTLTKFFSVPAYDPHIVPDRSAWEPLAPIWILSVRIQTDSTPERMGQAYAQLSRVRERFLRVFDFKVFDRRAHDTRNMEPRS